MAKKGSKKDKGKKAAGKKHPVNLHKAYEVSGQELKRKNQFCPKCGVGVHLGLHKDRVACGKCGYTEFNKG